MTGCPRISTAEWSRACLLLFFFTHWGAQLPRVFKVSPLLLLNPTKWLTIHNLKVPDYTAQASSVTLVFILLVFRSLHLCLCSQLYVTKELMFKNKEKEKENEEEGEEQKENKNEDDFQNLEFKNFSDVILLRTTGNTLCFLWWDPVAFSCCHFRENTHYR